MHGDIFQPCRGRARRRRRSPGRHAALPLAPVGFSALIERVCAFERRARLPRLIPNPSNNLSIVYYVSCNLSIPTEWRAMRRAINTAWTCRRLSRALAPRYSRNAAVFCALA